MKLDVHKDIRIESKIQTKKKQEFKQIGSTQRKRGQFLFALDPDTNIAYKVDVQKVTIADFTKSDASSHKAVINPNHPILWAINLKNAQRKFQKLL